MLNTQEDAFDTQDDTLDAHVTVSNSLGDDLHTPTNAAGAPTSHGSGDDDDISDDVDSNLWSGTDDDISDESGSPSAAVDVAATAVVLSRVRRLTSADFARAGLTATQAQTSIMECVMRCALGSRDCVVQSATGTGKTIAVLSPLLRLQATLPDDDKFVIVVASRTHAQLKQVAQFLSGLNNVPPSVVCGGRDRSEYCLHVGRSPSAYLTAVLLCRLCHNGRYLRMRERQDALPGPVACSIARGAGCKGCMEASAVHAALDSPIADIEDLLNVGKQHKSCPYQASLTLAAEAGVIMVPYHSIMDRGWLRKLGVRNYILVIDEAHNLPSTACDWARRSLAHKSLTHFIGAVRRHLCLHRVY